MELTAVGRKRLWWALWAILVIATLAWVNEVNEANQPSTRTTVHREAETPTRPLEDYWPPGLEVECGLGAAMFNDANDSGDTAAMDRIMDEMNAMGCLG